MNFNDFEPTRRLTTRAQAREAFDATLGETTRFLRIVDDDGVFFGFERPQVAEALRALLRGSRDARVLVVLRDTAHWEKRCPMLAELLRTFAPRLSVLRVDESLRAWSRGLVIADEAVVLRRPQFGRPITYVDYDDKAIAAASSLFEEILGHAGQPLSGRPTGL